MKFNKKMNNKIKVNKINNRITFSLCILFCTPLHNENIILLCTLSTKSWLCQKDIFRKINFKAHGRCKYHFEVKISSPSFCMSLYLFLHIILCFYYYFLEKKYFFQKLVSKVRLWKCHVITSCCVTYHHMKVSCGATWS